MTDEHDQAEQDQALMRQAIAAAAANIAEGGGPFGAVIARAGRVVALGTNRVTASHDPTAHAEVVAIRAACAALGTFRLDGCTLYTSCEPCPMCLCAAYWARIDRIVYAATRTEAAAAGFDDAYLYDEVGRAPSERRLPMEILLPDEGARPFEAWRAFEARIAY